MPTVPQLDALCTHGGAKGRAHAADLDELCAALGAQGCCRDADGRGPLVVVHCGDDRGRRTARRRADRHADCGVEIVHVRLDTAEERAQARRFVRGALRFATEAGGARTPRRGLLGALQRAPAIALVEERCPGSERCDLCASACAPGAIQAGPGGLPVVRSSACDFCGKCVERCPRGAWSWVWAPWPALLARLEAMLATPDLGGAGGSALLLSERALPPGVDGVRETVQPAADWILPLELPAGTLGAAILLRALELGAARVCAVLSSASETRLAEVESAAAVARGAGLGDAVLIARSREEALAALRQRPATKAPPSAPVTADARHRPEAWPIAERLWRGSPAPSPVTFRAAGAFASTVAVHGARCTLCDLCSKACPSGGLALRREGAAVALVLDPARCAGGCGLCARACPYGAITARDEVRLPAQESVLVAARVEACPRCGVEWRGAPAVPALEHRYDARGENGALRSFLAECPSCRRNRLVASLRSPTLLGPVPERSAPRGP